MAEVGTRFRWHLPRVRSYERVGFGVLALIMATFAFGLSGDSNLTIYGVLSALLAVGIFIGMAVRRKKDAFASAFVAGLVGLWLGFLFSVPSLYLLTQAANLVGFLLALLVGFALGLVLGVPAGVMCGVAGLLGSAVSSWRVDRVPTGPRDAKGPP